MPEEVAVKEIKLNITGGGVLPGEQVITALLQYATKSRETMSQENRDAWDKRMLEAYDRWTEFWKSIGVIK